MKTDTRFSHLSGRVGLFLLQKGKIHQKYLPALIRAETFGTKLEALNVNLTEILRVFVPGGYLTGEVTGVCGKPLNTLYPVA